MKKFFSLCVAVIASLSAMAQDWGPNVFSNSNLEGDDYSHVALKPNQLADGSANSAIFTGAEVTAETGLVEGVGVDGSKCVKVLSAAGAAQDWDAQFWIVLPEVKEVGDKFHVKFSYRAEYPEVDDLGDPVDNITIGTQAHAAPGNYNHWVGIGDVSFTKEWQVFEADVTISGDQYGSAGFTSIAFNLCQNNKNYDATFFFDNIELQFEKADETLTPYWQPIVSGGDFETGASSNFVLRINGAGGDVNPDPIEGVGVDESAGIMFEVPAQASQTWDSQFFIVLNEALPAGEMLKVEFDYKASEDMGSAIDTQCHGATPGSYIFYTCIGSPTFTSEWKHYEKTMSVSSDQSTDDSQFQTIAFNLAVSDHPVTFYLDNITAKHKKMVPISENPERYALMETITKYEGTYDFDNLQAWKANSEIRDAFAQAYMAANEAGDDDDFAALNDALNAAASKFAASVKDYNNLANFIKLISEKAEQAGKMGDDYADLKGSLEDYADPLNEAWEQEQWTKEEITAAINTTELYAKVKDYVLKAMKSGDDVTILINNSNYSWGTQNWSGSFTARANTAERWHASFDVNQTLADMPKGAYTLNFKGFQRHDTNDDGEEGVTDALVYVNSVSKYLAEGTDDAVEGEFPNSMETAREAFDAGAFDNTMAIVLTEAGDMKIGVKGTNTLNWVIWSDFQLIYKADDAASKAAAIQDQIDYVEAVKKAKDDNLNEPVKEKCEDVMYEAAQVAKNIESASDKDIADAIASLVAIVQEMKDVEKLMGDVNDAYDNFMVSMSDYYDTAAADIQARADKAEACFDESNENYYGKMTVEQLNAYVDELKTLAGALKIDKDAYAATDENPADLTALFENPDFEDFSEVGANKNYPGWSGSGFGTGGGTAGPVAERWNQSNGFDTYVDLAGLPEGTYTLSCDGAYRLGGSVGEADWNVAFNGAETDQQAFLYAQTTYGKNEVAIHSIAEGGMTKEECETVITDSGEPIDVSANCETYSVKKETGEVDEDGNAITESITYYFPNQLKTANQWMKDAGKYLNNNVSFKVGADGKARLGVARYKGQSNNWAFLDNFKLIYHGKNSAIDTPVETIVVKQADKGIYTITGVRVANTNRAGLYIINGKKVMVK